MKRKHPTLDIKQRKKVKYLYDPPSSSGSDTSLDEASTSRSHDNSRVTGRAPSAPGFRRSGSGSPSRHSDNSTTTDRAASASGSTRSTSNSPSHHANSSTAVRAPSPSASSRSGYSSSCDSNSKENSSEPSAQAELNASHGGYQSPTEWYGPPGSPAASSTSEHKSDDSIQIIADISPTARINELETQLESLIDSNNEQHEEIMDLAERLQAASLRNNELLTKIEALKKELEHFKKKLQRM